MRINDNFEKVAESYLFSEVASRLDTFRRENPGSDIIRMDIGDVTLPMARCVVEAMHRAVDELSSDDTFRGYGPEQGYAFLREAIAEGDYAARGIEISADDIFISDGAKSDLGNLGDIYSEDSIVALADPGYPVYLDAAVMSGRGGELKDGRWSRIVYLDCTSANGYKPVPPAKHADVVILGSPSNPTGAAFTRSELEVWVEYAQREKALIIYDSAYEAYVGTPGLPRSIYEIPGAETVAIEVRSFSKTAGFTGLRCGYTVVPASLKGTDGSVREIPLRNLWNRRQTTKFNGVSYVTQRGAEALYTPDGRKYIEETISIYKGNARIIRDRMQADGFEVFGGEDSPYVWVRSAHGESSWELFDRFLRTARISCTPGSGFGRNGEGFVRFTGFNSRAKTEEAMERVEKSLRELRK